MKKYGFLLLSVVTVCGVMLSLAIFSEQNAEQSNEVSGVIATKIYETLSLAGIHTNIELVHWGTRKAAHFTLFMLLGMGLSGIVQCRLRKRWHIVPVVLGLSILIAAADELHQYFSFDRYASLRDVLLDSVGALCGIMIIMLGHMWGKKIT